MIMPKGNEDNGCNHSVDLFIATEWYIEVSYEPLIEASMPHPPKPFEIIIIEDASTHIIDDFNSEKLCECAMHPPYN